jgi:hypothetical protein
VSAVEETEQKRDRAKNRIAHQSVLPVWMCIYKCQSSAVGGEVVGVLEEVGSGAVLLLLR